MLKLVWAAMMVLMAPGSAVAAGIAADQCTRTVGCVRAHRHRGHCDVPAAGPAASREGRARPQKKRRRDRGGRGNIGPGRITLTAERRERKPWAWAWDVLSLRHLEGQTHTAIVQSFADMTPARSISTFYVRACLADFERTGNPNHRTQEHSAFREESLAPAQIDWICDLLLGDGTAAQPGEPSLFFSEVQERFERRYGGVHLPCRACICPVLLLMPRLLEWCGRWDRPVSHRLISGALARRNVTLKKLEYLARNRNATKRATCLAALRAMSSAGLMEKVVIIDECHQGDRDRQRRRGWSIANTPATVYEYFKGDGTLRSLLCAADKNGFIVNACKLEVGGVTDAVFFDWAVQYLAPACRDKIVILDNAVIHHQPRFVQLMESVNATLFYLSPYSPDYSAIEFAFSACAPAPIAS
jgi:hypothetical protein